MSDPEGRAGRDVAVIDVGSNSVRLVVYRVEGRAIWSVYNEKVLAGLGQGVSTTGLLSPEGVEQARAALRRFKAVLDASPDTEILTAATAAVRSAKNGPEFVDAVEAETGIRLNVITGEEEARLGALGVVAGSPSAEGTVGDLGGSSLELTPVACGQLRAGVSLPLGPFALGAPKPVDADALRKRVDAVLPPRPGEPPSTLHAVGGAWRNLALIHMISTDYPLRIVHAYTLNAREALQLCQVVARQSRASLERIQGVSKKRAETLPYSALVLERTLERFGFKDITFSAYGVREGLLLEGLPPAVRALDPLVEGAAALGARLGVVADLGPALERWLTPLFCALPCAFDPASDARLLAAACRLADSAARLHPDHRAELAAALVLRAPIPAQTHAERGFLATAVWHRYRADGGPPEPEVTRRLLDDDRLDRARALGAALRLGAHLSGRTPALLDRATLTLESGAVVLAALADDADLLLGDTPRKRLATLANALGLPCDVRAT